jgi:hypothetical protein
MNLWQKIALYNEWLPLINVGQKIISEPDSHSKSLAVMDALEFLANRTQTTFDDGLVSRIDAVLRTPQGEDLLRYCVEHAATLVQEKK